MVGKQEKRLCCSKTRTTHGAFSPEGFVLLGLVSYHPSGRKEELAGLEGFGRTTSGFLFFGQPQRQGTGSRGRGRGATGCQSKGRLKKSEVKRKEASPKHILFVSTSKHEYLAYKSSEALPRGAFSDYDSYEEKGHREWQWGVFAKRAKSWVSLCLSP